MVMVFNVSTSLQPTYLFWAKGDHPGNPGEITVVFSEQKQRKLAFQADAKAIFLFGLRMRCPGNAQLSRGVIVFYGRVTSRAHTPHSHYKTMDLFAAKAAALAAIRTSGFGG